MTQYKNYHATNNLTLVGVFGNSQQIENALIELSKAGFKPDVITVLEKAITPAQEYGSKKFEGEKTRQANFSGIVSTVMAGAIFGGLIAGGITLIIGFLSIQVFELLEASLAGAFIGAAVGAVAVGFNKLGLIQNQAEETGADQSNSAYARLSINVGDEKTLEEVRAILQRNGAYGTRFYKALVPLPVLRARF